MGPSAAAMAHILRVRDNPTTDEPVVRWLTRAGHAVSTVSASASDAWFGEAQPELIIAGPSLRDEQLFARLFAEGAARRIPVLQLLAADSEPTTQPAPDACLVEPLTECELLSTVQLLLRTQHSERAAARAEQRWQHTFDAMSDAVVVLDAEQRVLSCNQALARLLSLDASEAQGRSLGELLTGELRDLFERVYSPGSQARWEAEVSAFGRFFRVVADESHAHPPLNKNGAAAGAQELEPLTVISLSDVTERRQLEEGYRRTAQELSAAARRKDELLAMMAHELRNPLNAIVASNRLQDSLGAQDAENTRLRAIVGRQSRQLARIIDDLLDASRFTRGDNPLHMTQLDLREVIERACASQSVVLRGRGQRLSLDLPDEPVQVRGDDLRLEQAVSNLLANASKYSSTSSTISLSLRRERRGEEERAIFSLRDQGIGIPKHMLEAVFEMFVQVDRSLDRTLGGLGLGLTVVKNVIERHGGRVWAHSEGIGKGSHFIVELPAQAAEPAQRKSSPRLKAAPVQPLDVLLVEDNEDTRELMSALLETRGYRVQSAADGPSAVSQARSHPPDVALVDIGLPGMTGYDVAQALRRELTGRGPFLVALTGYGSPEDRRQASEAGFDAHMVKPIDNQRLFELLQGVAAHVRRSGG